MDISVLRFASLFGSKETVYESLWVNHLLPFFLYWPQGYLKSEQRESAIGSTIACRKSRTLEGSDVYSVKTKMAKILNIFAWLGGTMVDI